MNGIRSKSEQLKEYIVDSIVKKVYIAGEKIPTEKQLMDEHLISRVTVSRVIGDLARQGIVSRSRGRGGTVVTENALEIIGFEKSVEREKLLTLGIVLRPREMRDSVIEKYFIPLFRELENEVDLKVFFHNYLNPERYLRCGCKLLIVDYGFPREETRECAKIIDLILFAREWDGNFIAADNVAAGEMALRYLVKRGHRKIVCFPGDYTENIDHYKGAAQAAGELDAELIPVKLSAIRSENIDIGMEKLMSTNVDFTAIIAPTDRDAVRICGILENIGKMVPEDVSIISYDNMFFSENFEIPLTTVSHPYDLMAMKFVEAVRRYIKTGKVNVQAYLPCSIMERKSVKAL